jgi:hypothetical protein
LTRRLDANRLPFRIKSGTGFRAKTPRPVFWPGTPLFWGSIVNAAANGKRLRAIDALQRSETAQGSGGKTA